MNLDIDHPIWLVLIGVGLVSAVWGWHAMRGIPKGRCLLAVSARAFLLIVLALAMSGIYRVQQADDLTVIAVIDRSGSIESFADFGTDELGQQIGIDESSREFLARNTQQKQEQDRLGIVVFDGQSAVAAVPARAGTLDRTFEKNQIDGSDINGAINLARSLVPPESNARIILISDGRATNGGLERIPGDVQIDVVPIRYSIEQEVVVESIEVPARALPGAEIEARVVLRSLGQSTGTLNISNNGEQIDLNGSEPGAGYRLSLEPGRRVVRVPLTLGPQRVHRFEALYMPDDIDAVQGIYRGDSSLQNNRAGAVTMTRSRGRVLVVSDTDENGIDASAELQRVLNAAQWQIDTRVPSDFPQDLLGLEAYDLVVLVNIARDMLPIDTDQQLIAYTQELGGGLIFVGGPEALGAGGWQSSDIEQIMPVKLEVADDLITPQVAVVFVLDSSGSMRNTAGGSLSSKQQIANNAAAEAIGILDTRDLVGVIAFSDHARTIVPIENNGEPEEIKNRIRSIGSGGGTHIGSGLVVARDMLASVEANTKHIILLSDGASQQPELLPELAEELGSLGIKVSTIAVGDEADEDGMFEIAKRSKGVYYRVSNPAVLPRIFLKAIRVVRAPMIREGRFSPVIGDSQSPATGPLTGVPALGGLVMTEAIEDDPRVLTPLVSDKGEPVLAYHQTELGRVAVFASDVSSWASEWISSPFFVRFWSTMSAWTMRTVDEAPGELVIHVSGSNAEVEYTAVDEDGSPIDGLDVELLLYDNAGQSKALQLTQVGAGRYSGATQSLTRGVHVLIATASKDGEPLPPTIAGLEISGTAEYANLSADPESLSRLADRTGGRVFELSAEQQVDLFSREGLTVRRSLQPIWNVLIVIAFVLFLIDLAMRRVAFDRWVAQAREDTIAAARTIRGEQLQQAFATRQQARASAPETPDIDRSPMMRAKPEKKSEPEPKAEEPKSDNPLMAAKRRAREQFDD